MQMPNALRDALSSNNQAFKHMTLNVEGKGDIVELVWHCKM